MQKNYLYDYYLNIDSYELNFPVPPAQKLAPPFIPKTL